MKKNFLVALSLAGALCLSAPGMEADAAWKITSSGRQYTLNDGQGYATGWKKSEITGIISIKKATHRPAGTRLKRNFIFLMPEAG